MTMPTSLSVAGPQLPVLDHLEILNLYSHYTHTVDQNRLEDWVDCYVEEGVLSIPAHDVHCAGAAQLIAFGQRYQRRSRGLEKHLTTNIRVFGSADHAEGICYLTMVSGGSGKAPPTFHTTGRYEDVLRRTAGGWRFVQRVLVLDEPAM
jgi:3-phenylpropionate/cinnamic acid dioxygenase small subunit